MTNLLYLTGLIAVGTTAYLVGKKNQKEESKNFTIKENVKIDGEQITRPEDQVNHMEDGYGMTIEPIETTVTEIEQDPIPNEPKMFPITDTIKIKQRGVGEYNKLIGQLRFEGYKTLAFAVSGYNSKFDYVTPICQNPDQKFAIILDEAQTNPDTVRKVQEDLVTIDVTDNVRLYTVEYQGA